MNEEAQCDHQRGSLRQGHNCFVKERQSDQPTWVPIMLSICEAELEDVSGDEREQHQTRLTNNIQWWRTAVREQ